MVHFDPNRPIFIQIAELIESQILSGELESQSRLPSIRELSLNYRVNPNTVQKALGQLEQKGLIETRRTQGKFVIYSPELIDTEKKNHALKLTREYCKAMHDLGFETSQILDWIREEENAAGSKKSD